MLTKRYLILVGWSNKLIYNSKIAEIQNKVPCVSGLMILSLNIKGTENENKIPKEIDSKFITSLEFHNFSSEIFEANMKKTNLTYKASLDT